MNLKSLFACAAMTYASVAIAATPVALELDALPDGSGFTQAWNEAEKCWDLNVTTNDFGNTRPVIQFKPFAEDLDPELITLAFEYKSTNGVGTQLYTMYKAGTKGTSTRTANFSISMKPTAEWSTVRIYLKTQRTRSNIKLGLKDQYQSLQFDDLVTGSKMQIRNIRFEEDEMPWNPINVAREGVTIVEAEDFNISANGDGHTTNMIDKTILTKYIDPTPGEFPIYAFTSADYVVIDNMETSAKVLQQKYKDLEEAGFNITEGTAWPGVDLAALWPDRDVNGVKIDLFEGLNLKMMVRKGFDDANRADNIRAVMNSPRLAGYCVKDEPHCKDFAAMRGKLEAMREVDNTHLLYGNLLHINTVPSAIGATSYDDYVTRYINETHMGFLSYDYYAVRQFVQENPTKEDIILMPNFFMNLEVISKYAKAYNTKFWAFTRAMSSTWHATGMENSVMVAKPYKYPAPTEDFMRVQAFGMLLYGAQGLQYWPYTACDGCDDSPIKSDGTRNPAWYYAKSINADVKALTWVFLGAEMLRVGHTNLQTPVGCLRLTQAMLPDGVTSVTTDGQGMPVSVLQNGNNLFMIAMNPDIHENQKITITTSKAFKQVLMDGTTEAVPAGTKTFELKPGRIVIYQVDDNAQYVSHASTASVRSDYRNSSTDQVNAIISADPAASNGYYLADMGPESWNIYSGITPEDEKREISEEDALANWGASFRYTIDVPEDITVSISVGHSVPWNEYGRVAAIGAEPGLSYTIAGKPSLNWPKQYAASMRLAIDGETVVPANQPLRPAVPATFTDDGAEFSRILADKSQWISTANADGSPSDVLYFWPAQGGDNSLNVRYNETPDYQGVRLSAGKHVITVTSLSYPWHFDNLKIETTSNSGIGSIVADDDMPVEWYNLQGIRINPETAAPGLYIRRQGNKSQKVAL